MDFSCASCRFACAPFFFSREYYARLRAFVHSLEEDADADAGSGLIRVGRAFLGARPSRMAKPTPALDPRSEITVKGFGVHVLGSDSNGFILNGVHRMGHGEGPGHEGEAESEAVGGAAGSREPPNPLQQVLPNGEGRQHQSGTAGESDGESDEDEEEEEDGEDEEEEEEGEEDDDDDDEEDNVADESEMYRAIRAMTSMDGGLGDRRQEYWAMGVGFCGEGLTHGGGGLALPKECRDGMDGSYPIPMDENKSLSAVAPSRSARTPRGPIWRDEEGVTWPMCDMSFRPSSVPAGASQ